MNNGNRIFGLRRNVFFLGLVSFFNDFSAEMVYAVMPAFLTTVLGAPPIFLGFMEGFVDAFASTFKIFSGWLSDKVGQRKWFAVSGYTLAVIARSFLSLVGNIWQVFSLRVVDRLGKGLRDSPRDALLSESVERVELGKSFGYHRAMDRAGAILGPIAAIILLPLFANDYRQLFLAAAALGAFAVLTFFFVKEIRTKEEIIPKTPVPFTFSLRNFSREFKLFLFAVFVFGLGVMPEALMLLKAKDIGLSFASIPFVYLVYTVSFTLFAIPFGKISDRIGEKKVLVGGFSAAIVSYAVLAFFDTLPGVVAGFVIFGLHSAMTDGVGRALTTKLVLPTQLATGQGFLQTAVGLSALLGGLIGGAIWTYASASAAFTYGAALMTVGLIVFVRLNGFRSNR
ncbi:MAG: MFS transporter [Candidatus Harrisonbacteria bacterium]|nr:MFS transporter [Candidatus Harrisonbacteria bacterium]